MLRLLMCIALSLLKFLHRSILPLFGSPGCYTLSMGRASFHQGFSYRALIIREVKNFATSGSLSSFVTCLLVSLCSLS